MRQARLQAGERQLPGEAQQSRRDADRGQQKHEQQQAFAVPARDDVARDNADDRRRDERERRHQEFEQRDEQPFPAEQQRANRPFLRPVAAVAGREKPRERQRFGRQRCVQLPRGSVEAGRDVLVHGALARFGVPDPVSVLSPHSAKRGGAPTDAPKERPGPGRKQRDGNRFRPAVRRFRPLKPCRERRSVLEPPSSGEAHLADAQIGVLREILKAVRLLVFANGGQADSLSFEDHAERGAEPGAPVRSGRNPCRLLVAAGQARGNGQRRREFPESAREGFPVGRLRGPQGAEIVGGAEPRVHGQERGDHRAPCVEGGLEFS